MKTKTQAKHTPGPAGKWGIIDKCLTLQEGKNVWIACQYFATKEQAELYRKKHCPVSGAVIEDPEWRGS